MSDYLNPEPSEGMQTAKYISVLHSEIAALESRCEKLERELAEAQKDSERLDRLERQEWSAIQVADLRGRFGGWRIGYISDDRTPVLPTLREAIDSALSGGATQEGE